MTKKKKKESLSCFLELGLGEKNMQSKRLGGIEPWAEYCC